MSEPVVERKFNKGLLVPLGVFALLVVILAAGFRLEDPHFLPSELIDQPFPAFALPELSVPDQVITEAALQGQVSLVNVWGTWCPNCLVENPELLRISREEDVPIYGINYNDDTAKARQWLRRHGNPFAFNIVDAKGRLGIDLGVYGAPETFLVDARGVIRYRHVGPVTRQIFEETFRPAIELLRSEAQS